MLIPSLNRTISQPLNHPAYRDKSTIMLFVCVIENGTSVCVKYKIKRTASLTNLPLSDCISMIYWGETLE